jgi:hypothetical protein
MVKHCALTRTDNGHASARNDIVIVMLRLASHPSHKLGAEADPLSVLPYTLVASDHIHW